MTPLESVLISKHVWQTPDCYVTVNAVLTRCMYCMWAMHVFRVTRVSLVNRVHWPLRQSSQPQQVNLPLFLI